MKCKNDTDNKKENPGTGNIEKLSRIESESKPEEITSSKMSDHRSRNYKYYISLFVLKDLIEHVNDE